MYSKECENKLHTLLQEYNTVLDNYKDVYKQYVKDYTEDVSRSQGSGQYDILIDFKNSSKYDVIKSEFDDLTAKKQVLETEITRCKDIINQSTIQLITQSIELNEDIDDINVQNNTIKKLKEQVYSSKSQKQTLYNMKLFKQKNIIMLLMIIVILIIIMNYLIFSK